MEFKNSYSKDFQITYSPKVDQIGQSFIFSIFDILLSLDAILKGIQSYSTQSMRLGNFLKERSNSHGFNDLPYGYKNLSGHHECLQKVREDLQFDFKDLNVNLGSIHVSEVFSCRSSDFIEQKLRSKEAKIAIFEVVWDLDITMENVLNLFKNLQNSHHFELCGMSVVSGDIFSSVSRTSENWKITGEFLGNFSVPWSQILKFLVSFIKYPTVLVYARSDRPGNSFISNSDNEKLLQIALKQDQCFKITKKQTSEKFEFKSDWKKDLKYEVIHENKSSFNDSKGEPYLTFTHPKSEDFHKSPLPNERVGRGVFKSSTPYSSEFVDPSKHKAEAGVKREGIGFRAQGRQDLSLKSRPELDESLLNRRQTEEPQELYSYTPTRQYHKEATRRDSNKNPDAALNQKMRYSSVDQRKVQVQSALAEKDYSPILSEKFEYRSRFDEQFENFKEKYKFLDSTSENYKNFKPEPAQKTNEKNFSHSQGDFSYNEVSCSRSQENLALNKPNAVNEVPQDFAKNRPEMTYEGIGKTDSYFFSQYKHDNRAYFDHSSLNQERVPKDLYLNERNLGFDRPNEELSNFSHKPLRKVNNKPSHSPSYSPYTIKTENFEHKSFQQKHGENEVKFEEKLKDNHFNKENKSLNNWTCNRCSNIIPTDVYECKQCRSINWDQFYRVKTTAGFPQERYGSVGEQEKYPLAKNIIPDEEADWTCGACQSFNKGIFFLCKSCRKPKGLEQS